MLYHQLSMGESIKYDFIPLWQCELESNTSHSVQSKANINKRDACQWDTGHAWGGGVEMGTRVVPWVSFSFCFSSLAGTMLRLAGFGSKAARDQ